MQHASVVIIGAGHGGVALAAELNRLEFEGSILLVNGESQVPYHRPPLSKAWLKGEVVDEAEISLQGPQFYDTKGLTMLSSTRIQALDLAQKFAKTDDGELLSFDSVVLAMGAEARRLTVSGASDPSIRVVRDLPDALELKGRLRPGVKLGIIGAGFVGLEVAASARHLGTSAHVFVRGNRVLSRSVSPALSDQIRALHEHHGVRFEFGTEISELQITRSGAAIIDGTGTGHEFDEVLVAVGSIPRDGLAKAAGLDVDDGVLVNENGRASSPGVYAIGDVARIVQQDGGRPDRLESVHAANDQAKIVAAGLAGHNLPMPTTPWFWSDQYDAKLQIAGLRSGITSSVTRSDLDAGSFALVHLADDRIVCVEALNAATDFAIGRRLIGAGAIMDPAAIVDAESLFDAVIEH